MQRNVAQLARYIRFQLAQLKAENKHHEFEHLARHFARLRICEHILPATGPVGAGGDQGRDFESYRTYLSSTPISASTFLGEASSRRLVFACSLKEDIEGKIRSDVTKICGGPKIDDIYFFVEADIPIGKRLELQKWTREKYDIRLEIFDGQALAEQLTNPDIFWIAEEYLAVSADQYPEPKGADGIYSKYKERWIQRNEPPGNFADFFEIKYGLRKATFAKERKPDLSSWMKVMTAFLDASKPEILRRRAMYELSVAGLRGQNNLDSKIDLVKEYFADFAGRDAEELGDAAVLLSYCSSARIYGHSNVDPALLHGWTTALWRVLKENLSKATTPGMRCTLYQELGHLALLPFRESIVPRAQLDDTFRYWTLLAKNVDKAPLFPLEGFADILTILTPRIGEDPRFIGLTNQIDELLTKRTGAFVAAEKCRDRAVQYLDAGRSVLAIKQLHTARIQWFAAETLKGSALSMLTLARCYRDLGLCYAGAYYALGAAMVAFRTADDDIKQLFPDAVFLAADCFYAAGATVTYLQLLQGAFMAHAGYAKNAGDIEAHEDLRRAFVHSAIARGLAERFSPELAKLVDGAISEWPIAEELKEDVRELSQTDSWTKTDSEADIWKRAQQELSGRPFSDAGETRRIEWKALGLRWVVEHASTYTDTLIGEEFAATCQIIAADLADAELCLLPMTVQVSISLRDGASFHVEERPDNNIAALEIRFPRAWVGESKHLADLRAQIVAVAGAVLRQCSALQDKQYTAAIERAFKDGLAGKAFSVQSYADLYSQLITRETFESAERHKCRPLKDGEAFEFQSHAELAGKNTPGPGYSVKKSKEFIANRYRHAIKAIRLTLPILLKDTQFREQIRKLRAKGYKDWQILVMITNIAIQYRVNQKFGASASPEILMRETPELLYREEDPADLPVPASVFTDERMEIQDHIMWLTMAKTWGLSALGQTPNFSAYEKLLVSRYRALEDDIPHDDLFPGA